MEIAARSSSRVLPAARVGTASLLACLVALSSLVHVVAGWLRATPVYFSDEYMYAELGRSLSASGLPLIRGELAPFPALVYPLLTAPAWLLGDVEVAWRLVQLLGAVAMSLACVPVFLLARRLGLGQRLSLGLAAFAIAVPDMVYAGWILAEPLAYPLALAAVAAGTVALATPRLRTQLLFAALAALATGTRAQFAVLLPAYAFGVLLLGLSERRLREAAREQAVLFGLLAAALASTVLLGPSRLLGMYRDVLGVDVEPALLLERMGANTLVLGYASAWILLPGALLGFGLALARPQARVERAFAVLAAPLALAFVVQASLFATPDHVQERYAFYALPLLALAFGLYAARGWPLRVAHAGIAALLLCVVAVVPLSHFTAGDGRTHSALLLAVGRLEAGVGDPAGASLVVAALAGLLLLVAVCCSLRPRAGTPVALTLALLGSGAAAVGATSFDLRNSEAIRAAHLPADPAWVERAAPGPVTLVRTPGGVRTEALEQLFWNPSVDRVVTLPGAPDLDAFAADEAAVAGDGTVGAGGHALTGALLVENRQTWIQLRGARRVAASEGYTLWQPVGRPRLALLMAGRHADGWVAPTGELAVWPERPGAPVSGRLRLELWAPEAAGQITFRFRSESGKAFAAVVPGGAVQAVELTVCSTRPWRATFAADQRGYVGSRLVSGRSSPPVFMPDADACGSDASGSAAPRA